MSASDLSDNPQWTATMVKLLALGVVCFLAYYAYKEWMMNKEEAAEEEGDPTGYLQSANNVVVNTPGYDSSSVRRLPPRFTQASTRGYRCLRCSDSGSGDADATIASRYPQVTYACAAGEAIAWNRVQNWKRVQESNGVAPGNLVMAGPAVAPPGDNAVAGLTGLPLCAKLCDTMPEGEMGYCKAAVYDETKNQCEFFYACDEVAEDPKASVYIRDFKPSAQPDLVVNGY